MCRMIAAIGEFSSKAVLEAAKSMSLGESSDHEHPVKQHDDAWGAVWRDQSMPDRILVHRSVDPVAMELEQFATKTCQADFLAIHLRKATIPSQQGVQFGHPISASGRTIQWYLMHNGCLPAVYRELGLKRSAFDSAEYFDYIVPRVGDALDRDEVLGKLEHLGPENTSANAFVINFSRFYVVHWYPADSPHPRFYTMSIARTDRAMFISSEVIGNLAPAHMWQSLPRAGLLEFPLPILELIA